MKKSTKFKGAVQHKGAHYFPKDIGSTTMKNGEKRITMPYLFYDRNKWRQDTSYPDKEFAEEALAIASS